MAETNAYDHYAQVAVQRVKGLNGTCGILRGRPIIMLEQVNTLVLCCCGTEQSLTTGTVAVQQSHCMVVVTNNLWAEQWSVVSYLVLFLQPGRSGVSYS